MWFFMSLFRVLFMYYLVHKCKIFVGVMKEFQLAKLSKYLLKWKIYSPALWVKSYNILSHLTVLFLPWVCIEEKYTHVIRQSFITIVQILFEFSIALLLDPNVIQTWKDVVLYYMIRLGMPALCSCTMYDFHDFGLTWKCHKMCFGWLHDYFKY